jgi:hypothetical protein
MQKKQQVFAVCLSLLHRRSQGLDVRVTVQVRPSLKSLNVPRQQLDPGQQFVEALLGRRELGLCTRLNEEVTERQETVICRSLYGMMV